MGRDLYEQLVQEFRKQIPDVLAADPDMILEACVFEIAVRMLLRRTNAQHLVELLQR